MSKLVPQEVIENNIFLIRGRRVMIDRDLAKLYRVETKYLNRQVRRNIDRFPNEFMFRLSVNEKKELVTKCHRFNMLKHSTSLPYAFTEYGVLMLANVIKGAIAIKMSVAIVRVFVRLREMAVIHADIRIKVETMEKKYDHQFRVVFQAIRRLLEPPLAKPKPRIGFHP